MIIEKTQNRLNPNVVGSFIWDEWQSGLLLKYNFYEIFITNFCLFKNKVID